MAGVLDVAGGLANQNPAPHAGVAAPAPPAAFPGRLWPAGHAANFPARCRVAFATAEEPSPMPPDTPPEAPGLLQRLLGGGRDRDGENSLLERQALQLDAGPVLEPARRRPLAHPPQRLLEEQVAGKLLHAWLQNRHQTLFPLALNLRNLAPPHRLLLARFMAASSAMAGTDAAGLGALLAGIGGEAAEQRALAEPHAALPPLLAELREAALGAHAYTVALLAIGPAAPPAGQAWLDYLAACFALPAETTTDLRRRSGQGRVRRPAR